MCNIFNDGKWFHILKNIVDKGACIPIKVWGNSMFPTFSEGDVVIIHKTNFKDLKTQDIIVYKHWATNITIHRIHSFETDTNGCIVIQTKGDNNPVVDNYFVYPIDIIGVVDPILTSTYIRNR